MNKPSIKHYYQPTNHSCSQASMASALSLYGINNTPEEIAEKIGSSQPNVSAAEKGESTRYIYVAISIIKYLRKIEIKGPYFKVINSENE